MIINNSHYPMLSLVHTIISLPLAVHSQNPVAIFIMAIVLHFLADMPLHWNLDPSKPGKKIYFFIALDVGLGLVAARLLLGKEFWSWPTWAAIAGGNAPDVAHALRYLASANQQRYLSWLKPFFRFHAVIQNETTNIPVGLISQTAAVAAALWLLKL